MMKLRLIANGSQPWERKIKRWGLSFVVDDDILFDAFGDAQVFTDNVRRFAVDVNRFKQVVISHEHWDHIEGLRLLLKQRPGLPVYVPQHADSAVKDKIRLWGGDVKEVAASMKIKEGVFTSGELIGQYAGKDMPEQALVLETARGLVVVAGCAHPGIVTIVRRVQDIFHQPIYGVVGGFHLKDHTPDEMSLEAANLKAAGITMAAPLHCTGAHAEKIFQQIFGADCVLFAEGQEITL